MEIYEVYVDASFDPKTKLAICGEMVITINNYDFTYHIIENTTNTEAEILGVLNILNKIDPINNLIIYTDCQMILTLINYNLNERKNNKQIYNRFYDLYDKFEGKCKFIKVSGHLSNKNLRSNIEDNFQF